ncbi:uncharacterized protein LOC142220030 [Haematobia irritans]|uniref:uncharacterized protein LOC142220030 n=1 Tax=Haematobia irritans TaxID=7368 RepID=UPI003F4FFCC8
MAVVPEFHITDTIHPAHVDEQKKAICEVPSELRKLSKQPKQDNVNLQNSYSLSNYRKRRAKRLRGLRFVKCLQKKAKHFVSTNHPPLIHNISDVGIRESEILQRSVSYGSFHSLLEETTDISHESFVDVSTESKIEKEVMDMETETVVEKRHDRCIQVNEDKKSIYTIADRCDISVQVNEEEIQTTSQMNDVPPHIICFLNLLNSTIPTAEFPNSFNWKFYQLWHTDCEFRDNLQLLVEFTSFRDENFDFQNISLHTYDSFVNAMNCLHILQDLFKPHMNPILLQIEEQVNEHLMHFYTKEKESQFYCTVYYPVKRSNHVIMS